ncbi:MAG: SH3 domain-containing protein [Calditrichaceae bacterium]|nr:SH3 domain-containing protein [Calditrichaceae bacterium]
MIRLLKICFLLIVLAACTKESLKKETTLTDRESASTAFVIKETVNLRSNNTTHSAIIKKLNDGQQVRIIRNVNGWYEIYDDENNTGWLRSDMVGPKELSRTKLAAAFVDSILPAYNSTVYFDNTDLYKTIYLILPESYYQSENKAESLAGKIGAVYQEKVYPGDLEIRIMKKNTDDLFSRIYLKAIGNADLPVPIIQKGRLISLYQKNWQIKIGIAVPADISKSELLQQARSISAKYELPYNKVEIIQAIDNSIGQSYLLNHSRKPADVSVCKLYYLEDKDGEYYKYNHCE